ncbi:hypothetical protein GCM10009623_28060 [Nocardioides aestuarii]|uniref:LPXTG cell wall anchor domain-containing protein n=1 Tax=Nocardioides aestuarii TaxID=252231 RepID=A0ABW4TMQ1_9ACTN
MMRTVRWLTALLATVLISLTGGAPAHADPDRLKLGLNGAGPFTESLTTPLFTGTYVPGTATSSFYVKNESPSTTRATIALVPKDAVNEFERSLSFTATVGGQTGTSVPLQQDRKKNECRTLVTGPTVSPGGVQRIDVTMAIDPGLSRAAMRQSASFTFVVTLSQVTKQGKVDVCGTQSPSGAVQVLGARAAASAGPGMQGAPSLSASPRSSAFVAGTALVFLASGAVFFVARRRRRSHA